VRERARHLAKVPVEAIARRTGIRASAYVAELVGEDLAALATYLVTPAAWSGDVPAFWRLVRTIYPSLEFTETPNQQGLGIDVIRYDHGLSIVPVLVADSPPG
jgi:hypothetical protein